jgi:hypothetical protein
VNRALVAAVREIAAGRAQPAVETLRAVYETHRREERVRLRGQPLA